MKPKRTPVGWYLLVRISKRQIEYSWVTFFMRLFCTRNNWKVNHNINIMSIWPSTCLGRSMLTSICVLASCWMNVRGKKYEMVAGVVLLRRDELAARRSLRNCVQVQWIWGWRERKSSRLAVFICLYCKERWCFGEIKFYKYAESITIIRLLIWNTQTEYFTKCGINT